ncbi:DNA-binding domain-containing protein [Undibacterium sp. TS12]|uniref:HvfC/BufC N-terminal domain-containing protein n=1 Tax=Undibacterium sp. TS12 TaxID=2908202 RepID=UPI001F4CBDB1|nr:DNA-binding domain-containing protein [Undibacterium sp. TS12]MCH8619722.1 DNA-binding domain-containing protein [Undibacterium sp. TS12]
MNHTQTLQTDFQHFILGQRTAASMHGHLADTPGLGRDARLDIYYQAYRLRLRDALSEAYTKTHQYLGDDLFYQACATYIDTHPSSFRNLRWFGDQFAEQLRRQFAEHPQVAELAQFEWALGTAFDAPDHSLLGLADLANISDWETVGLRTSSSLQFISMHSNSVAVWLALNEDTAPPAPEFTEQAVTWIVWRKQLQAHFRSISAAEATALQQLAQGQPFSAVCEQAVENNPHIADEIGGWLQTWVVDEMLAEAVEA